MVCRSSHAIRLQVVSVLVGLLLFTLGPKVAHGLEPSGDRPSDLGPVLGVVVPSIGLDSPVDRVSAKGGRWPVPRYKVGHLAESVQPGAPGTAVFIGHNSSGLFGKVFAQLERVRVGDLVQFVFASETLNFVVTEVRMVDRRDLSVLTGPPEPRAVLMTCAGRWDWLAWDYTHRLAVVATLPSGLVGEDSAGVSSRPADTSL